MDHLIRSSSLRLSQVDLQRAIGHWLNERIFNQPVKIKQVKRDPSSTSGFLFVEVVLEIEPESITQEAE